MNNVLVLTRTPGIFETLTLFMTESVWSNGQETGLITWLCHGCAEQPKSFPLLCLFFSVVMVHWGQKLFSHYWFSNKPVQPSHSGGTRWCFLVNNPCSLQGFITTVSQGRPPQLHQYHQVVGAVYECWCLDSYRLISMPAKSLQWVVCVKVSYRWSNNGWQTRVLRAGQMHHRQVIHDPDRAQV